MFRVLWISILLLYIVNNILLLKQNANNDDVNDS